MRGAKTVVGFRTCERGIVMYAFTSQSRRLSHRTAGAPVNSLHIAVATPGSNVWPAKLALSPVH